MKNRVLGLFLGTFLAAAPLSAQPKTVTGKVTSEQGQVLSGASVLIKGTSLGTLTNRDGNYSIRADAGQVLQFRLIGHAPEDRTVGAADVVNVSLRRVAVNLDAMVVTALGEQQSTRSLGAAQQTVQGADVAQTGRDNFVNALQGRVAGVEVVSSSGIPGASSSITIRGVSSISSSNQPLFIIDGLPMDNKTLNTGVLASDAPGSASAFSNRGVDFSNRAMDLNPEDIETMTVLKGPEAAALYGIDAANGAIVITTKRGKAGSSGWEYSNDFQINTTRARPELQRAYGRSTADGALSYFGAPYAPGTQFYDNIDGFFRSAVNQRHNLAFSGGSSDNRVVYRLSAGAQKSQGVVSNSDLNKINVTGSTSAQVTNWLKADLIMQYANNTNNQPYKGDISPLVGLLLWPQTDNAKDYLTPSGARRRITTLSSTGEVDNPYFNLASNGNNQKNNRLITNFGLELTPFSWSKLKTNIGADNYTNEIQVLRDPESAAGFAANGYLDVANDVTRSINVQTVFSINPFKLSENLSISALVGNQINDYRSNATAVQGRDFLDPNFISVNNTQLKTTRTTLFQRRLIGVYGSATANYHDYLYLTVNGRNDFTSTIPVERNSFFYPSVSLSFIASDAIPSLGKIMTAQLRGSYAQVGKDARPYAYRPALELKTTTGLGFGYGFTGPNLALKPEFAASYEYGGKFGFLKNRVGLDVATYRKKTTDQIVNDIRGSYATGFILFNLNGAETTNTGVELSLDFTPVLTKNFSWSVLANYDQSRGRTNKLPNELPESYVSDTWLFGNVRNGTAKGLSTRSLTGLYYLRTADKKNILIDPATGLPLRSASFIDAGYDRTPKYTMGITNTFRYGRFQMNFLVDIRRGGDIFNATEHYLTARGLSNRTLDREQPRVIAGVLRDGKENSATPTQNNIVVIPAVQTAYYTNIAEELFIEKNINWVRLKDVTLRYTLPGQLLKARDASLFVRGTDLFLLTNYSGLDPVVNGNTAAVGGSGAQGIDFGNFPAPRGLAFGLKLGY